MTVAVRAGLFLVLVAGLAPAQQREPAWLAWIPAHDCQRFPGFWKAISEFRNPALAGSVFAEAGRALREERSAAPSVLVHGYIELERYYDRLAQSGRTARSVSQEDSLWVPAEGGAYAWASRSVADASSGSPFLWQVCVLDDCIVSRTDAAGDSRYDVRHRGRDRVEDEHLFQTIREHASVVRHFVEHGVAEPTGYRLPAEAVAAVAPVGFRMPLTARSGFLQVSLAAATAVATAGLFDAAGRPVAEWESTWSQSGFRAAASREYLEGLGTLMSESRVRVVVTTEVGVLPDPLTLAHNPYPLHAGADLRRGGTPEPFDPTKGLPQLGTAPAVHSAPVGETRVAEPVRRELGVRAGPMAAAEQAPSWVRERLTRAASGALPPLLWIGLGVVGVGCLLVWWRRGVALVLALMVMAGCDRSPDTQGPSLAAFAGVGAPELPVCEAIAFAPERLDIVIAKGELRRLQVFLVNNSSSAIEVVELSGSCGCVFPVMAQRSVAALGAAPLQVEVAADDHDGGVLLRWQVAGRPDVAGVLRMPVTVRLR